MPKVNRFHNLKRPKVRQSWNKANLYNLSRLRDNQSGKTFYQQKWAAKAAGAAYHVEHIRQRKWERQFQSTIKSVVPMDHRYLATQDGSEQAEGRGSGKDLAPAESPAEARLRTKSQRPTPYMHMTFAPMERRLDTAIFRALFASSARQARQFVVHGSVKVNGKRMIHPGYLLNPGDMFQVDPERVLFATGAPKDKENRSDGIRAKRRAREVKKNKKRGTQKKRASSSGNEETTEVEPVEEEESAEATSVTATTEPVPAEIPEISPEEQKKADDKTRRAQRALFQDLLQHVKDIQASKDAPSAKRKQELRMVMKKIRSSMGRMRSKTIDDVATDINGLMSKLTIADRPKGVPLSEATKKAEGEAQKEASTAEANETTPAEQSSTEEQTTSQPSAEQPPSNPFERRRGDITKDTQTAVSDLLAETRDNPYNPSKPYATPWSPRPFMSAFAFIPRYLEVNQNICSAVYLRHPVARPGLAEVPTPFSYDVSQLAYLWYLRRR